MLWTQQTLDTLMHHKIMRKWVLNLFCHSPFDENIDILLCKNSQGSFNKRLIFYFWCYTLCPNIEFLHSWINNYLYNQYISRRGVLDTTLCDNVCQWAGLELTTFMVMALITLLVVNPTTIRSWPQWPLPVIRVQGTEVWLHLVCVSLMVHMD